MLLCGKSSSIFVAVSGAKGLFAAPLIRCAEHAPHQKLPVLTLSIGSSFER
jgi:hypothetical protein